MGRVKPNKPRRERPSAFALAMSAAYQCGHCHSATRAYRDEFGNDHLVVEHDDSCPVLGGTVPSTPDTARAIEQATDTPKAA
jgi:hypothetical protein